MKGIFKKVALATAITGCLVGQTFASDNSKTWKASAKAKQFIKDTIVMDFFASPYGVGWNKPEHLHDYLNRAHDAGITGASATLAPTYFTFEQFRKEHATWRSTMLQTPNRYSFVKNVEDIERAHKEGQYAVVWNSQTPTILDGDLSKLALLREMGLGSMQITYNGTYRYGDGVIEAYRDRDRGLTNKGQELIDEMVKQGVVVDLSHVGQKTALDATNYVLKNHPGVPVIYSHSLPSGLYKNEKKASKTGCYRNISDEQALLAAKTGGVISPTFTEWMMDGIWPEDITPAQGADMIDYYVKLVGVDHVGIATDDMFTEQFIVGFASANANSYDDDGYMVKAMDKGATGAGELSKYIAAVTDELWKRGYSNEDLQKIYAGNMMRVWGSVWK
ncbi:dipeptidase [Agaribacterium sp. ZY112]|uniref:dipeptidase n=1 Tax=Agaribacterium sp. ZY112 TaxID=3233574 RepID=UPI003525E40B